MNKITITIEEIKANPNLDLNERIKKISKNKRWSEEDLKELAIASIKNDYEYWANNRTNINGKTTNTLEQILNGHLINKTEAFEMICDDPEKIDQYSKCEDLKKRIEDSNGITLEDFNKLCETIGLDQKTTELIKIAFINKGLIINQYEETSSLHR